MTATRILRLHPSGDLPRPADATAIEIVAPCDAARATMLSALSFGAIGGARAVLRADRAPGVPEARQAIDVEAGERLSHRTESV